VELILGRQGFHVKISELALCVWEKDTPIGQHISNTQTMWQPETHTMRQATVHDWLTSLLAEGDKGSEGKNILVLAD
jgi:hypothetical protein